MFFGVQVRATAEMMDLGDLGRQVEAAGFESLFVPEHTHIPVSVGHDHEEGSAWLDACKRFLDPFLVLATVAAATTALKIGTGVCLVPQRHPITLAKMVATLDHLSSGRVLFGVGAGWDVPELAHHGVRAGTQWAVMREHVLAMRRIWTQEEAAFHGEYVQFAPIWQWPKPVQQPLPVLVGGEGPHVLSRVLEYGDGWLPNDHGEMGSRIAELHRLSAERGRAPIPVTVYAVSPTAENIERVATAGAARCIFNLPRGGADVMLTAVTRLAALITPWR